MYVKTHYINEADNAFERGGIIDRVTVDGFRAARSVAREAPDQPDDMLADLHDDNGDIVDVLCFSRQMRDRVVAAMRPTN